MHGPKFFFGSVRIFFGWGGAGQEQNPQGNAVRGGAGQGGAVLKICWYRVVMGSHLAGAGAGPCGAVRSGAGRDGTGRGVHALNI